MRSPPSGSRLNGNEVAVDAHVHLRMAAFDRAALEAAAANFAQCCPVASRIGVLMLADTDRADAFSRLHALAGGNPDEATSETSSLWFRIGTWRILVLAGQQIVTAERLEVLALATSAQFPDGLPLHTLMAHIAADDGLTVLPWGCGKWVGRRARLVADAIERARPMQLFLGDNSGRPRLWAEPLFRIAAARQIRILPGSDPLPIASQWKRIGRFGFAIPVDLSNHTPGADLKAALRDPQRPLRPYGSPESSIGFVRSQLLLRLRGAMHRGERGEALLP